MAQHAPRLRVDQHDAVGAPALQLQARPVRREGHPGDAGSRRLIQQDAGNCRGPARHSARKRCAEHDDPHHDQDTHGHHRRLQRSHRRSPLTIDPAPICVVAGPEAAGQRTDRFLADAIGAMSRTRVKGLIEDGAVWRDDVALRVPSEPVREGARYRVQPPALLPARPAPQAIPFTILFEDRELIVLDKPAGLVVHPAPGNEDGTLVNALLAHCGNSLPGIGGERRPGIVHRLDKDTSGVMVIAKTEQALAALAAMFAARDLDRDYLALVWGSPAPAAGTVEGPIGRDPRDRKRMAIVERGGKAALTRYATTRSWMPGASLLACQLATGRTHQIRVHLASIGHPLVGDPVYLRRVPAAAKTMAQGARAAMLDFPRQALHAASLGFRHPGTGEAMRFERPMPADMQALLQAIEAGI